MILYEKLGSRNPALVSVDYAKNLLLALDL